MEKKKCPKCGEMYTGHPALSMVDNTTMICPLCGVREAMAYMGVTAEEAEKVVETVRNNEAGVLQKTELNTKSCINRVN